MLRKSIIPVRYFALLPRDKMICTWIAQYVVLQCIVVFIGSGSILQCIWTPDKASYDFDKLARIMYLFDSTSCGYNLKKAKGISSLMLSNDTRGSNKVLPIKWKAADVTVSTKLSTKTRKYIELSVAIHVFWLITGIFLRLFTHYSSSQRIHKYVLNLFFYGTIFVNIFDVSMAVVYVAHIQQSLTKGMVVRYSGWSGELKLKTYDDFAGWLPLLASVCWMRGIVFLALNIYCCKIIYHIRRRIRTREFKRRLLLQGNLPVPDPKIVNSNDSNVLYYRNAIICIVISWLTLGCKLYPVESDVYEVTLSKLLYLYDPAACGNVVLYNYSIKMTNTMSWSTIVWPVKNDIASGFRSKLQVWLVVHLLWTLLAIVNMSQRQRPCGFYATLLPFTLTGVSMLVIDLVFAVLFLIDTEYTGTELDILNYINQSKEALRGMNTTVDLPGHSELEVNDTSWISVLLAYASCRGVVQWIINFWIIKDNYYEGIEVYQRLQLNNDLKKKIRNRSDLFIQA